MMQSLDLDKDFTFEFFMRFDRNISDDNSILFTKVRMTFHSKLQSKI